MKKLESTLPNMAIVLTVITIFAGAALGYVNELTKGPIENIKLENEQAAISEVLGGGDVTINSTTIVELRGQEYVVTDCGEKGCAVKSVDPDNASFGGGLTIMVGFDTNGILLGYKVLETNETPGLGAKAQEWFQKGQKGDIIGRDLSQGSLMVTKDNGDVDAITASTITSRAFLRSVNAAYSAYRQTIDNTELVDVSSAASQQVRSDANSGATTHVEEN